MAMVKRFEVYLVNLDPEPSTDARNTRPAVVISPDEVNSNLHDVIVAPLSTAGPHYPTRIEVNFLNSPRLVVLDQMRAVERTRLAKKIGELGDADGAEITERLVEMFTG
jgi:mRNA interferase MazF